MQSVCQRGRKAEALPLQVPDLEPMKTKTVNFLRDFTNLSRMEFIYVEDAGEIKKICTIELTVRKCRAEYNKPIK